MRKMIYFLLVPLVAIALLCFALQEKSDQQIGFLLEILENEVNEEITCWKQDDVNYYFFLPSYAELSKTKVRLLTDQKVYIDGLLLTNGMNCDAFELNTPYELTYSRSNETNKQQLTFIKSSGVATIHIDTESGNMNYVHSKKGNEESGLIRVYLQNGELNYSGKLETINGRGNYSWDAFEKKPYSIKLADAANLLGMGEAQKWILLANAGDLSNLRNKIVYDFANDFGMAYSPDTTWVDLYLNSEYVGLYLLSERNEVHSERVSVESDKSFLVSLEKEDRLLTQNYPYISTIEEQALRIHYPKQMNEETARELRNLWQSIENAILSRDGIDPDLNKPLTELIDLDSWVKKYLIEEVFGNLDGGLVSQYFYSDGATDLVFAGPVWDYDHALGNDFDPKWSITNPNVFIVNRSYTDVLWFKHLYNNDVFYNRLLEIYETELLPQLKQLCESELEDYGKEIEYAANMNGVRWEHNVEADHITYIKSYLLQHAEFLRNVWLQEKEYCQVSVDTGRGNALYYSVILGECFDKLAFLEETESEAFIGWYYSGTDELFDCTVPITKDIEIYAKWEEDTSTWLKQIAKIIPLAVLALLGVGFLSVDYQGKRRRGDKACP